MKASERKELPGLRTVWVSWSAPALTLPAESVVITPWKAGIMNCSTRPHGAFDATGVTRIPIAWDIAWRAVLAREEARR